MSASRLNRSRYSASADTDRGQHLQRVAAGQPRMLRQVDLTHAAGAEHPHDGVASERRHHRPTAWANSSQHATNRSSVRCEPSAARETQISIRPVVAFGIGEQRVAVVDCARRAPGCDRCRRSPAGTSTARARPTRFSADSSVSSAPTRTVSPVDADRDRERACRRRPVGRRTARSATRRRRGRRARIESRSASVQDRTRRPRFRRGSRRAVLRPSAVRASSSVRICDPVTELGLPRRRTAGCRGCGLCRPSTSQRRGAARGEASAGSA